MKKNFLFAALFMAALLAASPASALSPIKFGLKAGLQTQSMNLSHSTTLSSLSADGNLGFQLGAMSRISLGPIYIQPELVYNYSPYTLTSDAGTCKLVDNNLEVPVLLGWKILFLRVMAGPTFNLMDQTKVRSGNMPQGFDADLDKYALGYQVGLGIELLKRLNIDVRYDGQFSRATQNIVVNNIMEEFKTSVNTFQLNVGWFF